MKINPFGTLYVVATPIGNLEDLSLRAVHILKNVDYIAAEDTRHSLPLLQHYDIHVPLIALHEHNEKERAHLLLDYLQQGKSIALISDAGTPLISDPGYFLITQSHERGIKVVPIPGPCAAIAALSASGLPTDRFLFVGFLPTKSTARLQKLQALQNEPATLIFYEAPHRILALLQDIEKTFGKDRRVALARELTKKFETIHLAMISELRAWAENNTDQRRGEMVVVLEGAKKGMERQKSSLSEDQVLSLLLQSLPLKQAVAIAAQLTGTKKNILYQRALAKKQLL